jgi:hypothetical protein
MKKGRKRDGLLYAGWQKQTKSKCKQSGEGKSTKENC